METVMGFIFLGLEISADHDCSHEIQKKTSSWKNQALLRGPRDPFLGAYKLSLN